MDYKVKVAQVIEQAVDGKLSQEDILAKIEKPKTLNLGDYAFPAFVLSKVLRKAPQMIASELVDSVKIYYLKFYLKVLLMVTKI